MSDLCNAKVVRRGGGDHTPMSLQKFSTPTPILRKLRIDPPHKGEGKKRYHFRDSALPSAVNKWQCAGSMPMAIGLPSSIAGLPSNREMKFSPEGCGL